MERMTIEVSYKASIYGPNPKKPGETKLLFKNKKKRALIEVEDIEAIIEYHGLDGKLSKERCEIVHRTLGNMVIDMPFEIISEIKTCNRLIVKGYKQYKQKK
jgi:hypothetical protein